MGTQVFNLLPILEPHNKVNCLSLQEQGAACDFAIRSQTTELATSAQKRRNAKSGSGKAAD